MNKQKILEILKIKNKSDCHKRQVGAVIINNQVEATWHIVSVAYNHIVHSSAAKYCLYCSSPKELRVCPAIHAEIAALARGKESTCNSTMLISYSPCVDCCKAIIDANIARVVVTEPNLTNVVDPNEPLKWDSTAATLFPKTIRKDDLAEKLLTAAGIQYIKLWEMPADYNLMFDWEEA